MARPENLNPWIDTDFVDDEHRVIVRDGHGGFNGAVIVAAGDTASVTIKRAADRLRHWADLLERVQANTPQ